MRRLAGAALLALAVSLSGCADKQPHAVQQETHGSGDFEPATVRRIVDFAEVIVVGVVEKPLAETPIPASGAKESLGSYTTWSFRVDSVLKGEAGDLVSIVTYPDDELPAQFGSGEALLLALRASAPQFGDSYVPVAGLSGVWVDDTVSMQPKRAPFADSGTIVWSEALIAGLAAEDSDGSASDLSAWARNIDGACAAAAKSVLALRDSIARASGADKGLGPEVSLAIESFASEVNASVAEVLASASTTLGVVATEAETFTKLGSTALSEGRWGDLDAAIRSLGWVLYDAGASNCAALT